MDYGELLRVTGDKLKSVEGSYDALTFGDALDVYQEVAEMYAEYLGLGGPGASVIAFLMGQVATHL